MGEPVLAASDVPTTLEATRDGGQAVAAPLDVAGSSWTVTAVGMGNPHAVVYSRDGADVVVRCRRRPQCGAPRLCVPELPATLRASPVNILAFQLRLCCTFDWLVSCTVCTHAHANVEQHGCHGAYTAVNARLVGGRREPRRGGATL